MLYFVTFDLSFVGSCVVPHQCVHLMAGIMLSNHTFTVFDHDYEPVFTLLFVHVAVSQ